MATLQTLYAKRIKPVPVAGGSEVIAVRFDYPIAAVLASADILELGFVPANHKVIDWELDSDDLSSTAAGAFDLGILNAAGAIDTTASGGAAWVTGSTLCQAGGIERNAAKYTSRMVVSRTADQKIGLVMTASCTATTSGTIALTVYMIAA
jgi:hypothetical protein